MFAAEKLLISISATREVLPQIYVMGSALCFQQWGHHSMESVSEWAKGCVSRGSDKHVCLETGPILIVLTVWARVHQACLNACMCIRNSNKHPVVRWQWHHYSMWAKLVLFRISTVNINTYRIIFSWPPTFLPHTVRTTRHWMGHTMALHVCIVRPSASISHNLNSQQMKYQTKKCPKNECTLLDLVKG